MRLLIVASMAALMVFSGCAVSLRGGHGHGHFRHRSHHRHHRHHHHHHWNSPGPAYQEAGRIDSIAILPVTLPETIEGEFSESEATAWRESLPKQAADRIADGLSKSTDGKVTASTADSKPASGYYMQVEITYLDMGDPTPNADGTPKQRGSALSAHGVILNADTGEMVADVKFSESTGWTGINMFDPFMLRVGSSLGEWLEEKRE